MWKVNGRRTTDAKWWQKLTSPLARWAKNQKSFFYWEYSVLKGSFSANLIIYQNVFLVKASLDRVLNTILNLNIVCLFIHDCNLHLFRKENCGWNEFAEIHYKHTFILVKIDNQVFLVVPSVISNKYLFMDKTFTSISLLLLKQ